MAHQTELRDPQQQQPHQLQQQQEHQFYQGFYSDLAPPSSSTAMAPSHRLAPLQLEHNQSFSDEMDSYLLGSATATAAATGTSSPDTLPTALTPSSSSILCSAEGPTPNDPQASDLPLSATASRSLSNASSTSTSSSNGFPLPTFSPQIEEERLQGEGQPQLQEDHASQGQGVPDQQHMRPLTTTTTGATTVGAATTIQSQEGPSPSPNLASSTFPASSSSSSSSSFASSPLLPPLSFQQPQPDSIDNNMSVQYQQQQPFHPYPPLASHNGYAPTSPTQQAQEDGLPAMHRISLSDNGPVALNNSFPHQAQHTRTFSQPPLMIPAHDTFLNPIPAKSEDWAALVDTPASPIQAHPTSRMGPPFQQLPYPQPPYPCHNSAMVPPPPMTASVFGYTDSPAPEQGGEDYMQHGQVQGQGQGVQGVDSQGSLQSSASLSHRPPHHANTDPSPMGQNYPYQQHQHHKSFSGPGPSDSMHNNNPHMAIPPNRQANRKSWSPNSMDSGVEANSYHNSQGYLTPPRRFDTNGGGSPRSMGSHSKQGSVATSVSLLTDAAIVAKYRETAIKTNDASIQMSYAKYLLEIGEAPAPAGEDSSPPRNTPSPPTASPTPGSPTDEGNGKKQLALEAIYWIDRLAKEGQPEAQFIRGTWYEDGIYSSKKNADKALKWYQSASKGDYGPAHYKVGFYCEKKKDNNKAVVLYKKAAVHNDVPANHRLAMVYLYGELGQSKNMKAGLQYLKRAASFATESCPMSPYVLGLILAREYKQLAIPDDIAFPDDGEALEWFKKSASLGYGPANYKLGYCYEYGTFNCVIDPFLSVKHYERAVIAGDGNGEAEMALSGWYLSGAENCFPAQDHLAFQYAAKAAEKKLPKAQYAMGYYYEVGISVPGDMQKAMEFYQQAAANGNKEAQARLTEQASAFDKLGHKNSIRRIKQGRNSKDNNCIVM